MDDVHSQLRSATASLHRQLEEQLDLLNPARTLDDYRALMSRLYTFYQAVERQLLAACQGQPWQPEVTPRLKAAVLRRDLQRLGLADAPIDRLPLPASLPAIATLDDVLGVMYVLEGSTLGGVLLARHFEKSLGVGPDTGGAFWDFYGEKLRDNWTRYLQWLSESAADRDAHTVVSSAKATFQAYGAWLAAASPPGGQSLPTSDKLDS
jgi:heme oxygenase